MQAGILGVVDGTFDVVDSFEETVVEGDQELKRCLDVQRVFSLPSGETAFAGRAASEYRQDRETARIEGGDVAVLEEPRTATRHTNFAGVPGEFVVVERSAGTFAFDLVGRDTNTTIERATLDLDGFFDRRSTATPWKAGFAATNGAGVSGVLHGDDLRERNDLDELLEGSRLNQVGLTYEYGSDEVFMTAARSGYVELYRPREFGTKAYLAYLQREILPHLT